MTEGYLEELYDTLTGIFYAIIALEKLANETADDEIAVALDDASDRMRQVLSDSDAIIEARIEVVTNG